MKQVFTSYVRSTKNSYIKPKTDIMLTITRRKNDDT